MPDWTLTRHKEVPVLHALTLAAATLLFPVQDSPPRARSLLGAVPADSVMVLVVDDAPALGSRIAGSAWARVLRAEPFAPLWEGLGQALGAEPLLSGLDLPALLDAIDAAVGWIERFDDDEPRGVGLVIRLRGEREAVREALERFLESEGEHVDQGDRRVILMEDSKDASWSAGIGWREGLALITADDRESALEQSLALADRLEADDLDGGFAARVASMLPRIPAGLSGYLDLRSLLASASPSPESPDDRAAWDQLGMDDLGWLTLQVAFGEGLAIDFDWRVELQSRGATGGSLFARCAALGRTLPMELADLAPADTIRVGLLGFDLASAWAAVRQTLDESMPEQAAALESGLEASRSTLGLDLEEDLIGQLTGAFAEFVLPAAPDPKGPSAGSVGLAAGIAMGFSGFPGTRPNSVLVVELRDPAPAEDLLESLVELAGVGDALQDEAVGEHWMTSVSRPGLPLSPTWAFVDERLLLSLQQAPVRAVLAQAAPDAPPSWLEGEGHRAALAAGEGVLLSSVSDLEPWLQTQVLAPLHSIWALVGPTALAERSEGTPEGEVWSAVGPALEALPGLVAEHLRGTMGNAVSFENGVLRYHAWTR